MIEEKCENCKFFHDISTHIKVGKCRFKPPIVIQYSNSDYRTVFPTVEGSWWCGEFVFR